MKRYSTDRLTVTVLLSLCGALVSVLLGHAEVALFVAPWVVLSALGLAQHHTPTATVGVRVKEDRLMVDDDVELVVTIDASDDGLARVQPLFGAGEGDASGTRVEAVKAGRQTSVEFELPAGNWGTHDVGGVRVDITSPYGLFRMSGAAEPRRLVRVHPTPRQLQELLTPWLVRRVSGAHASRESAQGIEYADIRQFTAGDSVRDINWRASARSQDLWVSQRHPDRATDIVLLVDSFVETGHDVQRVFGLIVEAAVALAENHLGVTDRVGFIEFGGVVRWVAPSTGRVQLQRLTDALLSTALYANAADKEIPIMPARALPPRTFVVAFSPLLDERFVDAVFTLRGRGHDVAVLECDPEVEGSSALALKIWEAERSMLRDRMAEQGIAVATWAGDDHLDVALGQLLRRRRRVGRAGRR